MSQEISVAEEQAVKAYGWASRDSARVLSPFHFTRSYSIIYIEPLVIMTSSSRYYVVEFPTLDLHFAKDKVGMTIYPIVPGHEIVGEVTKVGCNVTKFKVGDTAGVGCIVGSCRSCDSCTQDSENYCPKMVWTYNNPNKDGPRTFGGYSTS